MIELENYIADVPDFPRKGIVFKDITPLLGDGEAMKEAVTRLAAPFEEKGVEVVTGIESRGFIFGSLVAQRLGAGFVPIRKSEKLPRETVSVSYELEYGTDTVEIHTDAVRTGQKVLMVDDLLATGGTMSASCQLVEQLGGRIVGVVFLIELCLLNGRKKLSSYDVRSLIKIDSE